MKKNVSFEKEIEFSSMIGDITSISLDHSLEFVSKNQIEGNLVVSGTYKMTEASTLEEKFSYKIPVEMELLETLEEDSRKVSISDFHYEIVNDDILKCNIELLIEGVEEIVMEKEDEEIELLEEEDINRSQAELFEISKESKEDSKGSTEKKMEEDKESEREESKEEDLEKEDNKKEELKELLRECDGDIKIEKEIEEKRDSDMKEEKEETKMVEEVKQKEIMEEEKESTMEGEMKSSNMSSLFQAFESSEETFTTYSVYIVRKEDSLDKIMDTYKVSKESLSEYNDLSSIEIGSKIIIPTCNE